MSTYFNTIYRNTATSVVEQQKKLISVIPKKSRDQTELIVDVSIRVIALNKELGQEAILSERQVSKTVAEQTLKSYENRGYLPAFKEQVHKLETTTQMASREACKLALSEAISTLGNTCFTENVSPPNQNPSPSKAKPIARRIWVASSFGVNKIWCSYAITNNLTTSEHLKTAAFIMQVCDAAERCSMRKSTELINKLQFRDGKDQVPLMSAESIVQREGKDINAAYTAAINETLLSHGFDPITCQLKEGIDVKTIIGSSKRQLTAPQPDAHSESYRSMSPLKKQAHQQERPDSIVNISLDGVLVKNQKSSRKPGHQDTEQPASSELCTASNGKTFMQHYTAVIEADGYEPRYLVAKDINSLMRMILATLLANNLLYERQANFFTDGAKALSKGIEKFFAFLPNKRIYTDWWHLARHLGNLLKSALAGTKEEVLNFISRVKSMIWHGKPQWVLVELKEMLLGSNPELQQTMAEDEAFKAYIELQKLKQGTEQELKQKPPVVKSKKALSYAIEYLSNKLTYISNFSKRHKEGLKVSSNAAESANEAMVSDRQKRNRSSWTFFGSFAQALFSMQRLNNEFESWFLTRQVSLIMRPDNEGVGMEF